MFAFRHHSRPLPLCATHLVVEAISLSIMMVPLPSSLPPGPLCLCLLVLAKSYLLISHPQPPLPVWSRLFCRQGATSPILGSVLPPPLRWFASSARTWDIGTASEMLPLFWFISSLQQMILTSGISLLSSALLGRGVLLGSMFSYLMILLFWSLPALLLRLLPLLRPLDPWPRLLLQTHPLFPLLLLRLLLLRHRRRRPLLRPPLRGTLQAQSLPQLRP